MAEFSYEVLREPFGVRNVYVDIPVPKGLLIQFDAELGDYIGTVGEVAKGIFLDDFLKATEALFVVGDKRGWTRHTKRMVIAPFKREPMELKLEPGQTSVHTTNMLGDKPPDTSTNIARPINLETLEADGHDVTSFGLLSYDCERAGTNYSPEAGQVGVGFNHQEDPEHPIYDFLAAMHIPEVPDGARLMSSFVLGLTGQE